MSAVIFLLCFLAVACTSRAFNLHFGSRSSSRLHTKVQLNMKADKDANSKFVWDKVEVTLRDGLTMTEGIEEKLKAKINSVVIKLGEDVVMNTHITLKLEPQSQICTVTCLMKGGGTVEATEKTQHMYASIELAGKKLSSGLKKHREKVKDVRRNVPVGGHVTEEEEEEEEAGEEEEED